MFVSVRKSSKAHSVSSRKVNLASKNPQLRRIHVLFAIQRHARRPATLVSPSPVEVRKFKWSATLEIGSNFNNHRERFRKLPIASVIIYYCTLLSFIKPRLNFWFLVIFCCCFTQLYVTQSAKTEADVFQTTFACAQKSFVDHNANIVSRYCTFNFNLLKSRNFTMSILSFSVWLYLLFLFLIITALKNCAPERLNFNGGYNCSIGSTLYRCTLKCGANGVFEFPPAPFYTCDFAKAKFTPEPIPKCISGTNTNKETWFFGFCLMFGNYFQRANSPKI